MTRKEQLKADLLQNFSDFQKIDPNVAPGGSDAANSIVAEGLADSIDRAIDDGIDLTFKGILRCSEINLLTDKKSGDLYTCSDAGILNGSVQLPVTKTSVVLWTGDRFKLFLVVPEQVTPGSQISIDGFFSQTSRNPVENRLVTAALAATINAINLHVQNQENPHHVTAEQVGAISATALDEAIESEATTRANADTALGGRIDDAEEAIGNEADERAEGDRDLQSQIDSITSKSDVVDVVDSYSDLLAYDTSELGDNDVIKILEDETHYDAESYYRWNATTETWGYIGSQGPFVTPAELQSELIGKVDKVTGKGLSTNDFTDAAKAVTDNIFLATYNSTSYADIKAAYDAGKTILCRFTDSSHTLRVATFDRLVNSTTSTSYAYFASVTKSDAYELVASKTRYGTTTTWSNTHKTWGALAEKDNVTNADISGTIQDAHIASASTWNGKQDAISDLSTIISNASNGQTSYGWGNHATWTPTFSQALSRTNLNGSGETIATIFGKIMKWFADLGSNSLAWISKNTSGSDSKVLSEKGNWVSIPSVPTALSQLSDDSTHRLVTDTEKSTWNGKQNELATQTVYSNKGSSTKVARITTNSLGQVTGITEVDIAFPSSSGMSTDASNADAVAIRNLINKSTSATNIGSDEYFVTVKSSGQWKYTMGTLKSWCTDGLANDSDVMHKGTSETITGEKTLSRGSGQNTYWRCQRTDTGNEIYFGIGSGGVNRGIYDEKTIGGWLLRLDNDGKVLLGDNSSKEGSVFLKLPTYASNYNISAGIWANNNPGTDVGDIQFGCFCYYGDTKRYGVQLDADRSSGQYGIWCYPTSAVSKWLCYMESDGIAHLGKNTDAQVQLGNRVFDFSGTFSASSNTIYFI